MGKRIFSAEHRKNISLAKKGICNWSKELRIQQGLLHRGKNNPFWGRKHTDESKRKNSEAQKGSKSHLWKGGISSLQNAIRHCFEYRQWVSDCFTRDNYVCQGCGIRGGQLQVHHKKSLSLILKENGIKTLEEALRLSELWNINNGETLCIPCHKKTDNYANSLKNHIDK